MLHNGTSGCSRNANVNFAQDLFSYRKYVKGRVIVMASFVPDRDGGQQKGIPWLPCLLNLGLFGARD